MGPCTGRAPGAIIKAPRGVRRGSGCPPRSPLGVKSGEGCAPSPDLFFFEFLNQNSTFSCVLGRLAISYRLADCLPESEIRLELKFTGDRSSILGTRPIITLDNSEKKNYKNARKIAKRNCAKITLFFSRTFPCLFS